MLDYTIGGGTVWSISTVNGPQIYIYFIRVPDGGVIAVEATVERLDSAKLEDGGGDTEYEECEEVGKNGSDWDHDHIRTVSHSVSACSVVSVTLSR